MKHWFTALLLLCCLSLRAQSEWTPANTGRLVNDYSGILSTEQVSTLEQRLEAFSDSTSNQVLIVITPTLYGDDEDAVAQRIGQAWGVGQADFDNGVVILVKSKTADENWAPWPSPQAMASKAFCPTFSASASSTTT